MIIYTDYQPNAQKLFFALSGMICRGDGNTPKLTVASAAGPSGQRHYQLCMTSVSEGDDKKPPVFENRLNFHWLAGHQRAAI